MHSLALATLVATVLASALARAEPACLPAAMFAKDARPEMSLGRVDGVSTLCAQDNWQTNTVYGCWSVDARTGALTTTSATWPTGLSQRVKLDAAGCIEGYCIKTIPDAPSDPLPTLARSTDGVHAAILYFHEVHVFEARSKTEIRAFSVGTENASSETGIGNIPIQMLYAGDTIYVVGTDAGPFKAVWAFRHDGTRLGRIDQDPKTAGEAWSVYGGTVNLIDDEHIALANSGTREMLILSLGSGARTILKRPVGAGPCSKENMLNVKLGDIESLPQACKRFIQANYEPYFDISPLRLSSGDFVATLAGPALGAVAILDGRTLVEKKRMKLRRCS